MKSLDIRGAGSAVSFIARAQFEMEKLEVESAKADIDVAKEKSKDLRKVIDKKEDVRAEKQKDLNTHVDAGPGFIEKYTGIGNHESVTKQKQADVRITDSEIEAEEAKLEEERSEISEKLTTVGDAVQQTVTVRDDIEQILDDYRRTADRTMRV